MGQTHRWTYPPGNKFDPTQFKKAVHKVEQLIDLCNTGIVTHNGQPVFIRDANGNPLEMPSITENMIAFNGCCGIPVGTEDLSCESFQLFIREENGEDFCKTNGKPYTIMVLAALITFVVFFPRKFRFKTEGTEEEVDSALFLYLYSKNPEKPITKQLFIDAKNKLIDLAELPYEKIE
jgi:hypothetical protein